MRLIDADKLIKNIENTADLGGWIGDTLRQIKWLAVRYINSAPSIDIDRPQEWIPCSERLPKENTEVLMSLEWGVDIGEYRNGNWNSEWINHYDDDNVLAWMPLPEKYKGE